MALQPKMPKVKMPKTSLAKPLVQKMPKIPSVRPPRSTKGGC